MAISNVRETARRQRASKLDAAARLLGRHENPPEGWIGAMRKALGMSAPGLARRLGVTKAAIYQAERGEAEGRLTLKRMERIADAMGGKFVYAIIPDGEVESVLRAQARRKAERVVLRASGHMALEMQSLPRDHNEDEIERLADQFLRDRPSDFWAER